MTSLGGGSDAPFPDAVVTPSNSSALFISHPAHIGAGFGGVQKCTQEFLDAIKLTGLILKVLEIEPDRRLTTKIARQFLTDPYFRPMSLSDANRIRSAAASVDLVIINQCFLSQAVVSALKGMTQRPPIIVLSHGCEITDLLHFVRLRRRLPLSGRARPNSQFALGSVLRSEANSRREIDGVITISPADAECERWFGVRSLESIPRSITPAWIDWRPVERRFGYVGTLDHAPNLEGLVLLLTALANADGSAGDVRIRLVGGPEKLGAWLVGRFPQLDYLGRLDDLELRREAETWQAFVHPIFCNPRGASTKLAQPIEWGIPILTTQVGRRGYDWTNGELIELDSPEAFVEAMCTFTPERFEEAREKVIQVASSSPSLRDVAIRIETFITERILCRL